MTINMPSKLVSFFQSFKSKHIYQVFMAEALLFFVLYLVFTSTASILQNSTFNLSAGKSPDELKQMLINGTAEQAQHFLSQLKGFLLLFVAIILALPTFFLFSYSFVQFYNWNFLHHKALIRKSYWRWNGLHLAVLLPTLVYLLAIFLFMLIISLIIPSENVMQIVKQFFTLIFMVAFFYYLFLVQHHFVQHHKVWDSIAAPFKYIKQHFSNFGWSFLFSFLTLILISLLQIGLNWLFNLPEKLSLAINILFFLLYLAWLRVYVMKMVGEVGEKHP